MTSRSEELIDELLHVALRGVRVDLDRVLARRPELSASEVAEVRSACADVALEGPASHDGAATDSAPQLAPLPHRRLGPYELERELGRGGQGVVWLARDTRLSRRVALKIVDRGVLDLGGGGDSSGPAARLRREAEVASKLDHPSICTVYEVGSVGERSFIAMRYVEGETLAARIAARRAVTDGAGHPGERRRDWQQSIELMERVARALHAAHQAGVLHRDIKSANVMVTPAGEPVILDFGLAHDHTSSGVTLTRTGDLLGSPAYMAPEQIDSRLGPVDARTDVYALGVVLFECLTLRRPFDAPTRAGLFRAILGDPTPSARRVVPALARDLDVVLATALERDRDRRYQTALDLAEDLRRVREHEPIRARPAGPVLRLTRWAQRNPAPAASLALVFVALIVALTVSRVVIARERQYVASLEALNLLNVATGITARDPVLAMRMAVGAAERAPLPRLRLNETLLAAWAGSHELARFQAHEQGRVTAGGDASGRFLATASGREIRVWDRRDFQRVASLSVAADVSSLHFSPDGRWLGACAWNGTTVWSTEGWRRVAEHPTRAFVPPSFAPAGDRLVFFGAGELAVFELSSAGMSALEIGALGPREDLVIDASWSPDGRRLLVTLADGAAILEPGTRGLIEIDTAQLPNATIDFALDERLAAVAHSRGARLIDLRNGSVLAELATSSAAPDAPAWLTALSGDGRKVLLGYGSGRVIMCEASSGNVLWQNQEFTSPLAAATFDASGERVLLRSTMAGAVAVLDVRSGLVVARFGSLTPLIEACWDVFDGEPSVLTVDERGVVRRWSLNSAAQRATLSGLGHPCGTLAFDSAGQRLAACAGDSTHVYDVTTLRLLGTLPVRPTWVEFDPSGERIVTASGDGRVLLWAARRFELTRELLARPSSVVSASFSPDGRRLVAACADHVAYVIEVESGAVVLELKGHSGGVRSAFFSGDGRLIVTSSEHLDDDIDDRSVRVWDARDGRELRGREFAALDQRPVIARFSPDGSRVAIGTWSGAVALWDWASDRLTWLSGHKGEADDARFTADGRYVLSGSRDRTLRLWAADTSELVVEFRAHQSTVTAHAISPDGRTIASQSTDGTLRFWPLDPLARSREILAALGPPTSSERERIADVLAGR